MLDKIIKNGLVLGLLVLATGCASSVVVKGDLPTPLVQREPINASLRFTDEFKNYVYTEKEKRRVLKMLDMTQAQIDMFESVFGALTNLVPDGDPSADIVIQPEILDFQYTAPNETKLKMYEIWLKYRLKILGANASEVADWTIKGYGKTPTTTFTSASVAFNAATNVALRDVGAQLSIGFPKQRKIKAIIAGEIDVKSPVVEVSETATVSESTDVASSEVGSEPEEVSKEVIVSESDTVNEDGEVTEATSEETVEQVSEEMKEGGTEDE